MEKVRARHGCTAAAEEVEFALRRMVKQLLHVPTVRARELAVERPAGRLRCRPWKRSTASPWSSRHAAPAAECPVDHGQADPASADPGGHRRPRKRLTTARNALAHFFKRVRERRCYREVRERLMGNVSRPASAGSTSRTQARMPPSRWLTRSVAGLRAPRPGRQPNGSLPCSGTRCPRPAAARAQASPARILPCGMSTAPSMRTISYSPVSRTSTRSKSFRPALREASMVASWVAVTVCSVPGRRLRRDPAERLVVGEFGNAFGLRVAGHLDLAPASAQRVKERHPAQQGTPDAGDQLDCLRHHQRSHGGAQHPEHAALAAGRHGPGRRRLRVEVAVGGPVLFPENADLAVEAENRAPHVGLSQDGGGVVDQVAGGEVVCAVEDEVVIRRTAPARWRRRAGRCAAGRPPADSVQRWRPGPIRSWAGRRPRHRGSPGAAGCSGRRRRRR